MIIPTLGWLIGMLAISILGGVLIFFGYHIWNMIHGKGLP